MVAWYEERSLLSTLAEVPYTCSKIKPNTRNPSGLLQPPKSSEWKWEMLAMNFITKLPKSQHRFMSTEIVPKTWCPVSSFQTVDGRDHVALKWQALQEALGTRLDMSTAYHPQTDGQSERTIQTLEDMLRACVMDFGGSWDTHLPLIEFSLYCIDPEKLCKKRQKRFQSRKKKTARSRQKSYADKRRKPLEFEVGDRVLLKVSPWKGVVRFGKKGKLAPRYVGPFEIIERVGPVAYRLKLPQELKPLEIMERDVKKLKRRRIPLVKVRWNSRQGAEYTWEREDQFRIKYPHLFSEPVPSSNVAT
ncbi:putative reverse transcriptase domain-containing protein [Tanacetum coccineum]